MNFLSKIIKPKDGEPELKQAHTGGALAARYDENLKRWIFPGEVCIYSPHFVIQHRRMQQRHKSLHHHR